MEKPTFTPLKETQRNNRIGEKEVSIRFSYISFNDKIKGDNTHVQLLIADKGAMIEMRFNKDGDGYKIQDRPAGTTSCVASRSSIKKMKSAFPSHEVEGRHTLEKINNLTYRITFKLCTKKPTVNLADKKSSGSQA